MVAGHGGLTGLWPLRRCYKRGAKDAGSKRHGPIPADSTLDAPPSHHLRVQRQPTAGSRIPGTRGSIHVPTRLRILVTLAALNQGHGLSFTRLQNMLDLTPGNLITHLRKLEDAGYLTSKKTGDGAGSTTTVTLAARGRAAPDAYTEALSNLLGGMAS